MTIHLHHGDLPADLDLGDSIAVDSETMGLNPKRDRLCLVQVSTGDGDAHLVKFDGSDYSAPVLRAALTNPDILKIFHFARFDVAVFREYLEVTTAPLYCTKIASKLVRTYTDRHGLKDLCAELLGVTLDKEQQSSDWGAATLSDAQQQYAANDVLYLHRLKAALDEMLAREGRTGAAAAAFEFVATRAELDLDGFGDLDIFSHS